MPAFTFECKNIKLSLAFDTITVYPTFDITPFQTEVQRFTALIESGSMTSDDMKQAVRKFVTNDGLTVGEVVLSIEELPDYETKLGPEDDEHSFYHWNALGREKSHIHFKFTSEIHRDRFVKILEILEKGKVITPSEKMACLTQYDKRFADARTNLDKAIAASVPVVNTATTEKDSKSSSNKQTPKLKVPHTKAIMALVKSCEDNDILIDLHNYLLDKKFDYIRALSGKEIYRGTDAKGTVVDVNSSWAWIEKSIALQIAQNFKKHSKFTTTFAAKRAKQLSVLTFFGLYRSKDAKDAQSPSFTAFQKGDAAAFEERYTSHFKIVG